MKSLPIHIGLIVVLTVVGFWLRFAHLDAINLYGDEYFQFESAVGYLKSGEFIRYNFYTEELDEPYTRAKIYTWQIAQSMKIFGVNEVGARFPAVIWGTLLIPLLVGGIFVITKQASVAYAAGLLVTFDNFFIEMSRFTRMYSMLFALTIVIVFGFYVAAHSAIKNSWRWLAGGAGGIAWLLAAAIYMELAMALAAAIGIYCAIRAFRYLFYSEPADRIFGWLFGIGGILASFGIVLHLAGWEFIPVDAFAWRAHPHFFYLESLFNELRVPELGLLWLLIGVLSLRSIRSLFATSGMIGGILLVYFIFLSNRWEAKRYIGFILPLLYVMLSLGFVQTARWLGQWLKLKPALTLTTGLTIFFVLGPWLSFPGWPADNFNVQTAYADQSYNTIQRANVEQAYAYILERYRPGEIVYMQGPRYFYWPDNSIPIQELGYKQELTLSDFKTLLTQAEQGGWIVYNTNRARNLKRSIRNYIEKNAHNTRVENDTGVSVHHFTLDDIQ